MVTAPVDSQVNCIIHYAHLMLSLKNTLVLDMMSASIVRGSTYNAEANNRQLWFGWGLKFRANARENIYVL